MIYGPLVKSVITPACHAGITGSSPVGTANLGVAQPGSAPALGAGGRRFDSYHRDQIQKSFKIKYLRGVGRLLQVLDFKGFLVNPGSWDVRRKWLISLSFLKGQLSKSDRKGGNKTKWNQ